MLKLKPIEKVFLIFDVKKLKVVNNPKFGAHQWITFCPAHNDVNNPNLVITELTNSRVLLRCFSKNCDASLDDILDKLGLRLSDLNLSEIPSAINKLLVAFFNPEETKESNVWQADCPICKTHSLFITELPNRKEGCWIKCENNCEMIKILTAANLKVADLKIKVSKKNEPPKGKQVARYNYKKGDVLHHQVVRVIMDDGKKLMPVRHKDKNGSWVWSDGPAEKILYNWNDLLTTKAYGFPRHFTEGEKNADRLAKEGYITTTNLGGSGRWKEIKDWMPLSGEKIILYQDNDISGLFYTSGLAAFLFERADEIKIITPEMLDLKEEGEDISDWFEKYSGTKEKLEKIIADCPIYDKQKATQEGIRNGSISQVLPPNYDAAASIIEKIQYLNKTESGKEMIGYLFWQGSSWIYNGKCYRSKEERIVKSRIWKIAAACKSEVKPKTKISVYNLSEGSEEIPYFIDKKRQSELYNAITNRNLLALPEGASLPYWRNGGEGKPDAGNILVIRNGYLDITDLNNVILKPSTPELFSPSLINVEIDPKNPPPYPDLWFKWLKLWMEDDDAIRESQKWSGYSLISNFVHKAMLCCLGHGDSGKTTWLYHFNQILGHSLMTRNTGQLGSRYGLARAPGKLLIIIDDASWSISKFEFGLFISNIKSISGGTPVPIRQMQNSAFDMLLFAKLIFATDDPPRFADPGGQLATRWRYLQFLFDFEEYQKVKSNKIYTPQEIRKEIDKMKAGIFWHYSIPGLRMLEEDRKFLHPKNTKDIIKDVEFASRPYLTFFKQYCIRDTEKIGWYVDTVSVWIKWKEFCDKNNFADMPSYNDQKTFTREFKRFIKRITSKDQIFYGFKLVKVSEVSEVF